MWSFSRSLKSVPSGNYEFVKLLFFLLFPSPLLSSQLSQHFDSDFDDLVVLIEPYDDDILLALNDPSPAVPLSDRRSSHGRYSKFGQAEAALLADEASDGPVLYKASVEKKIHTSMAFYAEFKAMSTLSFAFESSGSNTSLSVMPVDVFASLIKFGLHSDLCHYSVDGFLHTYLPNLETGLRRNLHVALPSDFLRIAHGVKERLENKGKIAESQSSGGGAEPIMQFDLEHIFAHMPLGWSHCYLLKAFMSLGLCCGARGVSLVNLRWKDLKVITNRVPESDTVYVTLTVSITVTKGGRTDCSVTFQGDAADSSCMNPFYHLNLLSLQLTKKSLFSLATFSNAMLGMLVFDSTADAMSGLIRVAAYNSGYPKDFFTSHSMRSGFLCCMVIHKYLNPQVARDDNDVLFISGIVAGWVPKAKAQLRYIKDSLKRVLVANRALVSPFVHVEDPKIQSWLIEELGANSLIAKNRLTPGYFHDLQGDPSAKWPLSTKISGFSNHFWTPLVNSLQVPIQAKQRTYFYFHNTYLPLYFAEKFEQQWEDLQTLHPKLMPRGIVSMCLSSLAETDAEPFAFFSTLFDAIKDDIEEYITDTSKSNKAVRSGKLKSKAHAVLRRSMDSEDSDLDLDSSSAERIVNELEQRAFKRGRTKSGARRRLKWTPDEDKLLAEMYLKHEGQRTSFVIISTYFEDRSNNDCKDRLKAVARSNNLRNYSYQQISQFILKNLKK
jgi:hypothetical protein